MCDVEWKDCNNNEFIKVGSILLLVCVVIVSEIWGIKEDLYFF